MVGYITSMRLKNTVLRLTQRPAIIHEEKRLLVPFRGQRIASSWDAGRVPFHLPLGSHAAPILQEDTANEKRHRSQAHTGLDTACWGSLCQSFQREVLRRPENDCDTACKSRQHQHRHATVGSCADRLAKPNFRWQRKFKQASQCKIPTGAGHC